MESRHLGGAQTRTPLELPRAQSHWLLINVRKQACFRNLRGINIPANFQKPHFPLETGGGMGYTHFRLARKGEMTDYPRGSDGEQP